MKNILTIFFLFFITKAFSQANVLPAVPQTGVMQLAHGTVHVGNGDVIEDGMIVFSNGKITNVGKYASMADAKMIDCTGKQIYPGLIWPAVKLALAKLARCVPSTMNMNWAILIPMYALWLR